MPPRPRRRTGLHRPETRLRKPVGGVKRSQLITTYGVGSMIAVDEQSFIVSGLDTWKVRDQPDQPD